MEQNNKKRGVNILIAVGVVFSALTILFFVIFFGSAQKAVRWDKYDVSASDKARIAEQDMLMPSLAEYIDVCAARGIRDRSDVFCTMWFGSVRQLFEVLPYETDEERDSAIGYFADIKPEARDYRDFGSLDDINVTAYETDENLLPLINEGARDGDRSYLYMYSYYIVTDEQQRARLICVRDGF